MIFEDSRTCSNQMLESTRIYDTSQIFLNSTPSPILQISRRSNHTMLLRTTHFSQQNAKSLHQKSQASKQHQRRMAMHLLLLMHAERTSFWQCPVKPPPLLSYKRSIGNNFIKNFYKHLEFELSFGYLDTIDQRWKGCTENSQNYSKVSHPTILVKEKVTRI